MIDFKAYLNMILTERQWSWTLIGACYLVITLFLRSILFRGILRESRAIDRSFHSEALRLYLKRSLAGWILFGLSFLVVVAIWIGWKTIPLNKTEFFLALWLFTVLFFLSVVSHCQAFTRALLAILRQRTGVEREF